MVKMANDNLREKVDSATDSVTLESTTANSTSTVSSNVVKPNPMNSNPAAVPNGNRNNTAAHDSSAKLPLLPDGVTKELVHLFKLLSDENRLKILLHLYQQEELHVRALCDLLGQSQPAVSHHLALLRSDGLIVCRRDGKHNFYHLTSDRIGELLNHVFANIPDGQRQLRIENYLLSFSPE